MPMTNAIDSSFSFNGTKKLRKHIPDKWVSTIEIEVWKIEFLQGYLTITNNIR
jgi:hypothetical protein